MEEKHRLKIQTNYSTLVKDCDVDVLLPVLLKKKVFSKEMGTKYFNEADGLTRKRQLFMDIQRRGPYAFDNLVAALRETNQTQIANLLEPTIYYTSLLTKKTAVPFVLPTNTEMTNVQSIQNIANSRPDVNRINISMVPIKIAVKGSTKLFDDPTKSAVPIYSTHSKKRGRVLLINIVNYVNTLHKPRQGADVDSRNLIELFTQIGLHVDAYEDLTGDEMKEIILNFTSSPNLKGVDMVFVIIMGHGFNANEGCNIPASDNKQISSSWIEQQFDNAHCKLLQNRPKIFIYQACRGNAPDIGVTQHTETDTAFNGVLRTRTDMLIAHSTLSGYLSHRDTYLGAWYVQKFCEAMMEHAHDTHLEDIFKMVDACLSHLLSRYQTMQTSAYTNQGFKVCYVHPKIYEEDGVIKDISTGIPIENVI